MKRKFVKTLCMAMCVGLLSGCGQKESTEVKEDPAETETPSESMENPADNTPQEKSETASADIQEDGQKEGYTADEMIAMLSNENIYAIKRGDLFYPMEMDWEDGWWGQTRYFNGNTLAWGDADYAIPTLNYAQDEALVVFSKYSIMLEIAKAVDTEERYCIPAAFQVYNDNSIQVFDILQEACVEGFDKFYEDRFYKYTEYEGNFVPGDPTVSNRDIMEGNKDEIKEFGGYEGTVYKTVQLQCTGKYYEFGPAESYGDRCQMTEEGYAILSDGGVNTFDEGIYAIAGTQMRLFEVINR